MGENREIQKGVWEGRIPVVFRLSEDDTEGERPEPVYVSVREVRSDMNQLIFGARIFSGESREPPCCEHFSPHYALLGLCLSL